MRDLNLVLALALGMFLGLVVANLLGYLLGKLITQIRRGWEKRKYERWLDTLSNDDLYVESQKLVEEIRRSPACGPGDQETANELKYWTENLRDLEKNNG